VFKVFITATILNTTTTNNNNIITTITTGRAEINMEKFGFHEMGPESPILLTNDTILHRISSVYDSPPGDPRTVRTPYYDDCCYYNYYYCNGRWNLLNLDLWLLIATYRPLISHL